ncbi:MAG: class I SAM-dependent methyltransferase [Thermoplasmata archaeon]
MSDYESTMEFWDKVFSEFPADFDASEPLPYPWMEEALDWMLEQDSRIIDFGCGSGKFLLRAAVKNASFVMGIDLSSGAIKLCEKYADQCKIPYKFQRGNIDSLKNIPDDDFHGGVLFNIVDNVLPEDSHKLLEHFARILKPGGKLLVKLNDYNDPEEYKESGAEEISEDFFLEDGLYLWNLTDEQVRELLEKYFKIEEEKRVYYPEHDGYNRLYYLVNG